MEGRSFRRLLSIVAVAGCWGVLIAPAGAQASAISGTVTDAGSPTNAGVSGVCVGAYDPAVGPLPSDPLNGLRGFTSTGPGGGYTMNINAGPGNYKVIFS